MIDHPLMHDLSDKTSEQLMEDIGSLTNKLTYMYRINKSDMVRQITMVLTAYRAEYNKRQEELFAKKYNSDKITEKININ